MLAVLVERRRSKGITQADLSVSLNKPQPFISKVERGVRRIDLIEFCAIARALGDNPSDLFRQVLNKLPRQLEI
jgi:transcriptional regulator with XRE-family HTH domain